MAEPPRNKTAPTKIQLWTGTSFPLFLEKRGSWLGSEQDQPWLVVHSTAPIAIPGVAEERFLVLSKDQPPSLLAPKNPSVFIDDLVETKTVLFLPDHSLWLFGNTQSHPEDPTRQGMVGRYTESATHTWTIRSQDHFSVGNVVTQVEKAVATGRDRIVVAGIYQNTNNATPQTRDEVTAGIFLYAYSPDGSIDKRFGKSGTVLLPQTPGASVALRGLVVFPKQELLVAYEVNTYGQGGSHQSYLALYEPEGQPHLPFGTRGILPIGEPTGTSYHSPVYVQTIAPATTGFIVAGSYQEQGAKGKAWVAKYRFDGTLDSSFGDRGSLTVGEVSMWTTVAQIGSSLAVGGVFNPGSSEASTPIIGWITLQGQITKNPWYQLDSCPQGILCRPKSVISADANRALWLVESLVNDTPYARLYPIALP